MSSNNPNRKPSSRTSAGSVASVGIGTERPPIDPQALQLDVKYITLRAHNASQERNKPTYDCVVYLLYCPEHDKIAVSQVDNDVFWFPFITREGRTWKTAMHEGLQSLLETKDADGSVVRSMKLDANLYTLELFRLQCVDLGWSQRMTQFVSIRNCTKTCEPANNLTWLSATELIANCDTVFWGPEFRQHFTRFREHADLLHQLEVVEQTIDPVMQHICTSNSVDLLDMLFQSCNLLADQLYDLYDAYLWHVYPAYYMSLASFRIFLRKNDFSSKTSGCKVGDDNSITQAIFRACLHRPKRSSKGEYIDFLDLAYALVSMDPNTPTEKARVRFLFSFYDSSQSGTLDDDEVDRLATDSGGVKLSHKLTLTDFQKAIQNKQLPLINQVCRLPQSVFTKMADAKKVSSEMTTAKVVTTNKANTQRERCVCPTCRVKKFEYCKHCVTIDSMGRCVEPKIILNCDNPTMRADLKGPTRHSMECAFNSSSIGNLFFDHIRTRRILALDKDMEQQDFYERFKDLCDQVAMFVKLEPKILKRQSPAVIIGDLNGHMESLFALEMAFWRTMPVIGDNVIFLGNYTGNSSGGGQGIEMLAYLFAIKYLCPNKVVLLRGVQETKAFNEKTLLIECRSRLGDELGTQVWNMVNDIFQHLPVVAVVNETIFCASSGIPKDSGKHRLSNMFESLGKDNVLFQQVATNMPDRVTEQTTSRSKETLFKPIPLVPNAFTFSHQAFKEFMQVNQFFFMIRSNEALADGFRVCFNRRLITIVSNCNADGESPNQAVVALVSHPRGRIQLAQIECPLGGQ